MATRYQGKQVAESPPVKVQEKQREYQKDNSEKMNKIIDDQKNDQNKITNNRMYNQLRISKRKT